MAIPSQNILRPFEQDFPFGETYSLDKDGRPTVTIEVGGIRLPCLVDTGAGKLVLPWVKSMNDRYGDPDLDFEHPIPVATASSGELIVAYEVKEPPHEIEIRLEPFSFSCSVPALFSEQADCALLGRKKVLSICAFLFEAERFHIFGRNK